MQITIGMVFKTHNDIQITVKDIWCYVAPLKNYDTWVIYEYQYIQPQHVGGKVITGCDKTSMESFINEFYRTTKGED